MTPQHPKGDDLALLGCNRTDTPLETPAELCIAPPPACLTTRPTWWR